MKRELKLTYRLLVCTALGILLALPQNLWASVPATMHYQGRLMNNSNEVLSTAHTFRFSFWTDDDYDSTDLNLDGTLNESATGYAGWQETYEVTPNSDGLFSLDLGSVTPLPTFDYTTHKFLQVEVKAAASPDTAYEVLDPDGDTTNTTDRKSINSVPYAVTADNLNGAQVGTGSGSIALLGSGGKWSASQIPGATNESSFAIDQSGASVMPTLQFGSNINNYLRFSIADNRLETSGDMYVAGDLIVEGSINANIAVTGTTTETFRINSDGDISAEDAILRFGDGDLKTLTWDASEQVFDFNAPVTISGSAILTEANLGWDDLPARNKSLSFAVEYPDAGYKGDGSNNVGLLSVEEDATNKRLYYSWTSPESSLNDYDVVIRVQVPQDFVSWQATPLSFAYQTSSATLANNKLDVTVTDTSGNAVTLSDNTDLYSASWANASVGFTGGTFTPGAYFTIVIKASAKDNNRANLSELTLNYTGR